MSSYHQGGRGRGGYHPGGGQRGGHPRDPDPPSIADLWPGYLDGGYFDEQGCLKIDYVSRDKVEPLVKAMCDARPELTTHQIRRYFGHCRAVETRLRNADASWERLRPEVAKLDIAAADGFAKSQPKIPAIFHEFIKRNVDKIRTRKDFLEGFLPHFEAIVGFGQAYFRKERS